MVQGAVRGNEQQRAVVAFFQDPAEQGRRLISVLRRLLFMSSFHSVLTGSLGQKGKMLIDFRFKVLISEVFLSIAFCLHLTSTKICIWVVLVNVLIC